MNQQPVPVDWVVWYPVLYSPGMSALRQLDCPECGEWGIMNYGKSSSIFILGLVASGYILTLL